tara:strand:+ start:107 stop:271 length:165 start_codon:yes stop_codon:yes gene_type:complete
VIKCDECGAESKTLWDSDEGQQVCSGCILAEGMAKTAAKEWPRRRKNEADAPQA